jgi:hypothetical protein
MSVYVYRITAKKVRCSDGKEANVAVYAYKPFFTRSTSKENSRMHFSSGCVASERLAKIGKILDRIVIGDKVYENVNKSPYLYDCDLGEKTFPLLGEILAN